MPAFASMTVKECSAQPLRAAELFAPKNLRIGQRREVAVVDAHIVGAVAGRLAFNRRLQRNHTSGGGDFLSGDIGLIKPTAIPSGSSMIA